MSWIIDLFTGPAVQIVWAIIIALVGFLGFWGYGKKRERAGRAIERRRAQEAQDTASDTATEIRKKAAAKPVTKKRTETSKWER